VLRNRPRISALLALLLFAITIWLSHALWLPWFGEALIRDDGPANAEIAVVLAGDLSGHRIQKAAELARAGYVPLILVSGPPFFDIHECDEAIAFALRKGYPAEWFIPSPNQSHSTREEASDILAELRRRGIHRFLLVTSDYHTARAARIYRASIEATGGGFEMRMVAAPDPFFRAGSWWRDREAQKTVFFEWAKTLATTLGQ
jgi:uncharacterized SAM-binding protein YcdF (DUF218 family)